MARERLILGFHQDPEGDNPPWQERAWVLSSEGRVSRLGTRLICRLCGAEGMG
jgi:hypothetical protein